MKRKNIWLDEGAFQSLKNAKRPGETYSDAIHRLFARKAVGSVWKNLVGRSRRKKALRTFWGSARDFADYTA